MRLAFVDLVFTWPPAGGAPADLYYTASGLQELGHEVRLFHAGFTDLPEALVVRPELLPFECERLPFSYREYTPAVVPGRVREAVDAYRPDIVFQCFGFFLKPYVSQALSHYPQIARYYAYEPMCPRDYRLYYNFDTCPNNFLVTPKTCRRCVLKSSWRDIRVGTQDPGYVGEYIAAKGHTRAYYKLLVQTLRAYKGIIVYNHFTKDLLGDVNPNVYVIGGGVRLEDFTYDPLPETPRNDRTVILMTGRADDHSKGTDILFQAGKILAQERDDFVIKITHPQLGQTEPWFHHVGWHEFSTIKRFYQESDICVFPSRWEEPFGLVAVEAMATGRPVVVGDVGGLQEIVVHGETGFIYPRNDAAALAGHLRTLLDDAALRKRMGDAGRHRVEERYEWHQVIRHHYPEIIERALA